MCRIIINNGGGAGTAAIPREPSSSTAAAVAANTAAPPPPTKSNSFVTVSTLSTSRSSSSSSIGSSSSTGKRVSFNETIKIHPYKRHHQLEDEDEEEDALSEDIFWYCPQDYRRFRSDICLEMLDRQQQENSLMGLVLKFVSSIKTRRQRLSSSSSRPQAPPPLPLPKVVPTIPQEDPTRAQRIIEELAFLP